MWLASIPPPLPPPEIFSLRSVKQIANLVITIFAQIYICELFQITPRTHLLDSLWFLLLLLLLFYYFISMINKFKK